MALILSSLFISAAGLPTRATDCWISSSSTLLMLTIFSGSACWGSWTEMKSRTAPAAIISAEMSKLMARMAVTLPRLLRMYMVEDFKTLPSGVRVR